MNTEKIAARGKMIAIIVSMIGVLVFAGGALLANLIIRHILTRTTATWPEAVYMATPAVMICLVGLLMAAMPWLARAVLSVLAQRAAEQRAAIDQLMGALETQRQSLEALRDAASLSDAAKHVAYRHKDRQALRDAIREELDKSDFEAAMALANEMEERFGYRKEAQQFRSQIAEANKAAAEQEIADTLANIEVLMKNYDWDESFRQYDRLAHLYPEHPTVKRIPERIQTACNAHKRELLNQWKDAVARDDVDRSIALLKELDRYLSPSEAEAYKESARDVFRKRLQQMGVQFALHVHDKNWNEAIRIGKQIMDEFPNTRIAAEVKEKWDVLQVRARETVAV